MSIIFLVEERSMKEFLSIILPRILPCNVDFKIIPHSGKSDLQDSIPHKLRAWTQPDTKFVVVQDQDSADCKDLKQKLQRLCDQNRPGVLVRIACVELEAWYFGDLNAVSKAYGKDLTRLSRKSKYRNPDHIGNPKSELKKLLPEHQQILGARRIAPYIDIDSNLSRSFHTFVDGVRRLVSAE
jgi:hypothetical protein